MHSSMNTNITNVPLLFIWPVVCVRMFARAFAAERDLHLDIKHAARSVWPRSSRRPHVDSVRLRVTVAL